VPSKWPCRHQQRELRDAHGVGVHTVIADLSTRSGAATVIASVEKLPVDVFVSNAGSGGYGALETRPLEGETAAIALNCTAPMELARGLLPGMRARDAGALIFVSSIQAELSLPFFATYAATKAFTNVFAEALYGELLGTGVDVLTVLPGITSTEFFSANAIDGEFPLFPVRQPEQVVETALSALGRRVKVIDGLQNRGVVAALGALPRRLLLRINAALTDPAKQKPEVAQAHAARRRVTASRDPASQK